MRWLRALVRRFWNWVTRLPKAASIPAAVVIVAGLGAGSYFLVDFYSYMQDDPEFCHSCHIMAESWDRWATSQHSEVGCHSCHHQSIFASAGLLFDFVFRQYDRVESHAAVEDEYCASCHESGDPEWRQVAKTAGHRQHTEEEHVACTKCHSITLHRFQPPAVICELCHAEQHIEVNSMNTMHCPACHDFLAVGEEPLPTRDACLDCHQALNGDVVWSADDPMQYPCGDCHLPHQAAGSVIECESCHAVEGYHLKGAHEAAQCYTCHQPHDWQTADRLTCLKCHPGQEEHGSGAACDTCHSFTSS